MAHPEFTQEVQAYYDRISPHYERLWGPHIHHGYYLTGRETKQQAVEQLLRVLVNHSALETGSKVLDVGCGIGGTSIWLTEHYNCEVTGITISPRQADMANRATQALPKRPRFMIMDANHMTLDDTFDAIWAVEVLSHLHDHPNFFRNCRHLLKKRGKICIAAWLKANNLSEHEEKKYIRPIEEGMLCLLPTANKYLRLLKDNRFRVLCYEDVSSRVKQTWNIGLDIIKNKSLWDLAAGYGQLGLTHLKAFRSMKRGYDRGHFLYVFIIAEKL